MMTPDWTKSSHSPNGGDCVECRRTEPGVDLRDSKNPDAGYFSLSPSEFLALTHAARNTL